MTKTILRLFSFLLAAFLLIAVSACSAGEPPATSTLQAEISSPAETPTIAMTSPTQGQTPEATEQQPGETLTPGGSGPTAVIVSGESAGVGKPFTFDATQSQADSSPIVSYVWTLGDGATLFGVWIEYAYKEPGFYTVNLVITDADGRTDTEAKVVEIVDLDQLVDPTAEGGLALIGTFWKLDNSIRGTAVTLTFTEATVSGSAGCNDYQANYDITLIEGSTAAIKISAIRTTSETCTPEVMAQERGYLESLASASRITVDGSQLIMETGAGTLHFSRG